MHKPFRTRRYLASFDAAALPQVFTDCLIIGSGIAGLRAAIEVGKHGRVTLLTKRGIFDSNTAHAQGGVAVVLEADESDNLDLHVADTLKVGCGLNDLDAVRLVVGQGPDRVRELIEWGARFDSHGGELDLGREAGHSASRVIHAHGDATGREIARALHQRLQDHPNIQIHDSYFVVDLLTDEGRCLGALVHTEGAGFQIVRAKQTILATGGCGRVYQETTNPEVATGDGMAMAWRAGAVLQDMEMMQFHPTTLYVAGASRALISEAVRGEGGYLVDRNGERFMPAYHEDAELAPRDVVSRAIIHHMKQTGARNMFLDVRHLGKRRFATRFPNITELCASFGIDVGSDLIPIRPSAHYMLGGVKVDLAARTSIENLYACGEAACTGLHGANRLASNSLLEGLVFGYIAGCAIGRAIAEHGEPLRTLTLTGQATEPSNGKRLDLQDVRNSLRSMMWRHVGIERNGEGLAEAAEAIGFWGKYLLEKTFADPFGWEEQNLLTVAWLMVNAARQRTESRGVHFRQDFPAIDDKNWLTHIQQSRMQDFGPGPIAG
ncbi:MAG: L-aspartate oxidase [Phycisphaerae bacterium]|nr:L-aspartate oxidase [Phycisphaerae bacterium]